MKNTLKDGTLSNNSAGIGTVTPGMVRERAIEVALINGRSAQHVSNADWDQAKRELTGETATADELDAASDSERWDLLPGSDGHKASAAPSDDEDDEGRSDNERLVQEGIAEAEHDQMLQSAKAAEKDEK
jgi:hypothetical protein